MLIYIHLAFARRPIQCLENVKTTWPRDGILRVEIMRDAPGFFQHYCNIQWEPEYRTFDYRKHLKTKIFEVQISNGLVFKWLVYFNRKIRFVRFAITLWRENVFSIFNWLKKCASSMTLELVWISISNSHLKNVTSSMTIENVLI